MPVSDQLLISHIKQLYAFAANQPMGSRELSANFLHSVKAIGHGDTKITLYILIRCQFYFTFSGRGRGESGFYQRSFDDVEGGFGRGGGREMHRSQSWEER